MHRHLNPIWVGEGDDQVEILVIEITVQEFKIRCINAYGPQETDPVERKRKFWARLEAEVIIAENHQTGFILEMDGNLHAGADIIPGDPNNQNQNG